MMTMRHQTSTGYRKIDAVQPKLDNAISLLHDKENNSGLVEAKAKLDAAIGEEDPTPGMTQATEIIIERKSRSRAN